MHGRFYWKQDQKFFQYLYFCMYWAGLVYIISIQLVVHLQWLVQQRFLRFWTFGVESALEHVPLFPIAALIGMI